MPAKFARPRLARPIVFRTSLAWAALAAAGASLLAMKLTAAVLFMLYTETAILPEYWRGPLPAQWTQFFGAAFGVGVAWLAGGRSAVALFLALNVAVNAPFIARQILSPSCGQGVLCLSSDVWVAIAANWPFAVGTLVGAGVTDLIARQGPDGRNSLLETAGAYGASTWVLLTLLAFLLPQSPELGYMQLGVAGLVATCAAAMTCVLRSVHPVRDTALVAVSLFVAETPGVIEQIKQWVYFGVIDLTVINPAALGMLSALLLVPLAFLVTYVSAESADGALAWNPEKGGGA